MNISRASAYGREPYRSTITRTSTPAASFCSSRRAISMPISPSRQPNIRMCTDERAASMSARIRGKKLEPSTRGSMLAAVDQAKSRAASCGRAPSRRAKASVAARAPAAVTAVGGGGQVERCVIPNASRYTTTNRAARRMARSARAFRARPAHLRLLASWFMTAEIVARDPAALRRTTIARIAIAAAVIGVFLTWTTDEPVSLNGTQGPQQRLARGDRRSVRAGLDTVLATRLLVRDRGCARRGDGHRVDRRGELARQPRRDRRERRSGPGHRPRGERRPRRGFPATAVRGRNPAYAAALTWPTMMAPPAIDGSESYSVTVAGGTLPGRDRRQQAACRTPPWRE